MPIEDLIHQAERNGRRAALCEAATLILQQARSTQDYVLTVLLSDLAQQILDLPPDPPAPLSEAPPCDRPTTPTPPGGDGQDPEPFDEMTGPQVCS